MARRQASRSRFDENSVKGFEPPVFQKKNDKIVKIVSNFIVLIKISLKNSLIIGRFVCGEDDSKYEGEFAHGRKHGKGVLVFENGAQLHGRWQDGNLCAPVDAFVFPPDSPWLNQDL